MKRDAIVKSLLSVAHSCLGNFQREIFPIYYSPRHKYSPTGFLPLLYVHLCDCHACVIGVTIITLGVRGLCLTTSLSRWARLGPETVKTDERHSVHKYTLYNFYRSSTRVIAEALTSLFRRNFLQCCCEWFSKCWKHFLPLGTPAAYRSYFPAEENRAEGKVDKSQMKQVVSSYQKSIQL